MTKEVKENIAVTKIQPTDKFPMRLLETRFYNLYVHKTLSLHVTHIR